MTAQLNPRVIDTSSLMTPLRILIAARGAPEGELIRGALAREPGLSLTVRPLDLQTARELSSTADVLILQLDSGDEATLEAIAASALRTPTIVVGPPDNLALVRAAMRAGMRDYLPGPVNVIELIATIRRLASEHRTPDAPRHAGKLIAVINAKGGSGASFVAANLAHLAALQHQQEIGLLDLDLQFGALPQSFDLERRSSLLAALSASTQIDELALRGYLSRHTSGIQVLSAMSDRMAMPGEVPREALVRLLDIMRRSFPFVIADLPRQIDPLSTAIFELADQVLMVTQQSLAHTRDAKRLQQTLLTAVGVPRSHLCLVVNRHRPQHLVRERDIREAVDPARMILIPDEPQTVSETYEVGLPVLAQRPDSGIARALTTLGAELEIVSPAAKTPASGKRSLRAAISEALRGR